MAALNEEKGKEKASSIESGMCEEPGMALATATDLDMVLIHLNIRSSYISTPFSVWQGCLTI